MTTPALVPSSSTASNVVEDPNTGDLQRLTESFEAPNGTDNAYNSMVGAGSALNPDYSSPALPSSWGSESGLITVGAASAASLWMKRDNNESPTGYYFTGSYELLGDGLTNDNSLTVSISKPTDFSGPLASWRLSIIKDDQGQLQLIAAFGKDTTANNSSARVYNFPISANQVYDVTVLYDNADRFYSWSVNGQSEGSGQMGDDWPLIGTEIIGSSGSGNGRNSQIAVDNIGWYELPSATSGTSDFVLGSDGNNIFRIRSDGSNKIYLTDDGTDYLNFNASWSSDGSRVVYARRASGGSPALWIMNADGTGKQQLTSGSVSSFAPVFSPDGTSILFTSGSSGSEVWVMNSDGSDAHALTDTTGSGVTRSGLTIRGSSAPSYSPDGKKIAYSSTESGRPEIWVMNADGSGKTQITFPDDANAPDANAPAWSPDGSKIAFWSGFTREYGNIYTVNPDGSDRTQLTFDQAGVNSDDPSWLSDGKSIGFDSTRNGTDEIWMMNADGSDQRRLLPGFELGREPITGASEPATVEIAISSGTTVSGIVVNSGNVLSVYGTGVNTIVNSGGQANVYSGGVASGTTIDIGGIQYVAAGGIAGGTTVNNGEQDVAADGLAQLTTISSGGAEYVYSGGVAEGTTIDSGGSQTVSYDGVASNTTVSGGGTQNVSSNGVASNTTLGGTQNVYYSGARAIGTTINSGGLEYVVSGGIASGTTINSGGSATIGGGATAITTTIAGGTLELSADAGSGGDAGLGGPVTFSGSGGTLRIDGATLPTATISGFTIGDTIDLAGIGFDSGGTATLASGNVLKMTENGTSYTLTLDPNQNFAGYSFSLASDGHGGTQIIDPSTATPVAQSDQAGNDTSGFTVVPVSSGDQTSTAGPTPEIFDFSSVSVGNDTIAGFDPAQDAIRLSTSLAGSFAAVQSDMSAAAAGTLIVLDATHSITLSGIAPASLTAANFRFG